MKLLATTNTGTATVTPISYRPHMELG